MAVLAWRLFAGLAVALAVAFLLLEWRRGLAAYRSRVTKSATVRLYDLFLFLDARQWWRIHLLCTGLAMLLGVSLSGSGWGAVPAGAGALFLPRLVYRCLQQRRWRQIDEQLPDALLTLASALRAGIGLMSALRQVVDLSPTALQQELGLLMQENRVGMSLDEALQRMEQRLPLPSICLWSAAMRVSAETGGNLAAVLERLATMLREQRAVETRLRALTSQGRLQARVLLGLPWLVALAMMGLDPVWMRSVWTTPEGRLCLGVILVLQAAGWWSIRRIVRVRE